MDLKKKNTEAQQFFQLSSFSTLLYSRFSQVLSVQAVSTHWAVFSSSSRPGLLLSRSLFTYLPMARSSRHICFYLTHSNTQQSKPSLPSWNSPLDFSVISSYPTGYLSFSGDFAEASISVWTIHVAVTQSSILMLFSPLGDFCPLPWFSESSRWLLQKVIITDTFCQSLSIVLHVITLLILTPTLRGMYYYLHFTNEETEVQRLKSPFSKWQSWHSALDRWVPKPMC